MKNKESSILQLGLIIFLITFSLLGIPFSKIGFDSDCFGLVFLSSQINGLKDLLTQMQGSVQSSYEALNEVSKSQFHGFLTYFRPIMTLSHYVCYKIFGLNAYAYHLVNVGLHATTSSIVFIIFSKFISCGIAFLLALLFAFFPALTPAYVGVTSHVVPTYLFAALMIICYQRFLLTNRQRWQLVSAIFFLISLFCYEIIIVFPIVLTLFLFIFQETNTFDIKKIVRQTYAFWIALLTYFVLRLFLLGSSISKSSFSLNFFSLIQKIIFNWYQAIKPFFGLQDFSKLVTIFVALICIIIIIFAFIKDQTTRKIIYFCSLSFFILAWPISFVTSDGRYFYLSIPMFIFMFYIALESTSKLFSFKQKYLIPKIVLLIGIVCGALHGTHALIIRSFVTNQRDKAFERLARDYKNIKNLRLIMIGTLHCFNNDTLFMQQGMTQAARLFFNNPRLEAYHVTQAKIFSHKKTMKSFIIESLKNGFKFKSPDEENLFFMIPHTWKEENVIPFSMGKIIVHKKHATWKASEISFLFDEKWLKPEDKDRTIFVSFDLSTFTFKELYCDENL